MEVKRIVVVENNILTPWVPCCFSHDCVLQLFDFWQDEHEPKEGTLNILTQYYGDVKLLNDRSALLLPATLDDERIIIRPFWTGALLLDEPDTKVEWIEVGSQWYWEYCFDFSQGRFSPALFLQNGEQPGPRQSALLYAAREFGVSVYLDEAELYREKIEYNEIQFIPVLKNIGVTMPVFDHCFFIRILIAPGRQRRCSRVRSSRRSWTNVRPHGAGSRSATSLLPHRRARQINPVSNYRSVSGGKI